MNWVVYLLLWECTILDNKVQGFQPPFAESSSVNKNGSSDNYKADHRSRYSTHFEDVLVSEFQHTSRELQEQRRTWSRRRLEESGISIFGAIAEPDTELFGEKVVRIVKPHAPVPFRDKFSRGDVLLLTPIVPNIDPIARECLVMDVGKDWMTLGVGPAWLPGLWESRKVVGFYQVRLDRAAPQTPLKAQKMALRRLEQGLAGSAAELLARTFQSAGDVDELASEVPLHFRDAYNDGRLEDYIRSAVEETKEAAPFQPNPSQETSIIWALQRSMSLIRGPAGTGKTRVAAMLISVVLKLFASIGNREKSLPRVLAVAHSNGAADVLLEALLQLGVPAVRLGRPASVSPNVQHRTVVAMAEKIPQMAQLRRTLIDQNLDSQSRSAAAFELRQSIIDMQELIMQSAPVVVTSCIGAHQLFTQNKGKIEDGNRSEPTFDVVVLDEAAQTTEPALLCALAAAKANQVVMVGDTRQLPPTIALPALRDTLGISPMARLENAGVGFFTLQTQYRMHPSLLEHPSNYFYKGLVKCADEVIERSNSELLPKGFAWPCQTLPLTFVNVGSGDAEVAHNFGGRSNPTEARLVCEIVSNILGAGDVKAGDVAVISPYAKQVELIRTELASRCLNPQGQSVAVGTVDSFQGQEKEVVVISTVRSNPIQELGFLRDARRLCVAITRARRGLIIVGDRSVLQSCRHWAALLKSCDNRECSIQVHDLVRRDPMDVANVKTRGFESVDLFDDLDEFYGLFFSSESNNVTIGDTQS